LPNKDKLISRSTKLLKCLVNCNANFNYWIHRLQIFIIKFVR